MRRRAFLGEVGKGTVALAVFSPVVLAACGDDDSTGAAPTTTTTDPTTTDPTTTDAPSTDETSSEPSAEPLQWARAALGNVSAYVLARGTEAAVIDTGNPGSAADIGDTLAGLGLGYADVRHVVLTHWHPDHVGSASEILTMAESATAHAGALDLDEIALDSIEPLDGGEEIFGLEILATPGHTEGHVAVIDHETGLLVAGDALNSADGGVLGPNANFTADIEVANESVRRLAELTFNTLLVGHGDPIEGGADTAVVDLATSLA